ncbi:MAG: hypothetical protein HY459_04820 [Parcubacteria group bacterium]|nr:hypothetical protein [Parcubacteria group bacterium]
MRIQSDCILPGIAAINAIDGFTPEKVILIGDSDSGYPPNADLTSTLEGSCAEDLRPPVPGLQFPTRIADWISWIASVNTNSATIDTIQVGSPAGATTACALVHIAQEFGGTFSWYTCGASCPNDIVNYCNYVVPDAWKYIPACQDGRDNEDETRGRDGLIDYPEDPQCDSPSDISEDP